MLTRRLALFAAMALVTAVSTLALFTFRPPRPAPVRAYHRVELGMTRAEVEAAVGMPPVEDPMAYAPWAFPTNEQLVHEAGVRPSPFLKIPRTFSIERCYWDRYVITLIFDMEEGKAVYKRLQTVPTRTLFDRARRWLGL